MKTNTVRAREICNELREGAVLCKKYSHSRRTVEDYVTLKLYEAEQRGWEAHKEWVLSVLVGR